MLASIPLVLTILSTITPGVWDGYKGTTKISPQHTTIDECVAALEVLGPGNYACRTITRVVISEYDGDVNVSWTPPTHNTNGSVLADLAGYVISYGPSAAQMNLKVTLTDYALTHYLVKGLSVGAWYFSVEAVNSSSVKSVSSNVATKVVP